MKRMFAILVVVALLVSLAACASSGAETPNPGGTSEHYIDAIGTESMEAANPSKGGESVNNGGSTSNTGSDIATSDHSGSSTGGSDDGNSSTGSGSTTPSNPQPQPTNPQPTNPQPTNPQPTNPQPTNPQPTNPQPTNPQPTEPKPTNPQPTNPQPTEPKPTEPVHVHSYTKKVTKPTCMEDGYTTYTCSCGYSYQSDNTPATGHSYGVSSSVPATCIAEGSETYKCSNCGDTYTEIIPMTDHDWQHNHTDAVTHEVIVLHCCCGWECTNEEAEAHGMDIYSYHMFFHVKQYYEQGIANGHSYNDMYFRTVVDVPAHDEWVCKVCGKSSTSQP